MPKEELCSEEQSHPASRRSKNAPSTNGGRTNLHLTERLSDDKKFSSLQTATAASTSKPVAATRPTRFQSNEHSKTDLASVTGANSTYSEQYTQYESDSEFNVVRLVKKQRSSQESSSPERASEK